jgi:hypothetical protein
MTISTSAMNKKRAKVHFENGKTRTNKKQKKSSELPT